MNIRKLPSGSYQVRKQYKGKQYSFTIDHKPTQKEVIQLLADVLEETPVEKGTFESYANRYIESKQNLLSSVHHPGIPHYITHYGGLKGQGNK